MKIIGLIAVRMKSSRLKKKALLCVNEIPLIIHLLNRLKDSEMMDDVILCTSTNPDDQILIDIAEKNGFKSFAGDEDDVLHRFICAAQTEHADVAVRITGDNPLTDPGVIDQMIKSHLATGADYTRMDKLPVGITAEVISVSALKRAFSMAEDSGYSEYMTYYFVNYPEIFMLNIIEAPEILARRSYRLTVDYQEDYELIKRIFEHFTGNNDFTIYDVIEYLDKNPQIAGINSNIKVESANLEINTRLKTSDTDERH